MPEDKQTETKPEIEDGFAYDAMTGPAKITARRFAGLAKHVAETLPAGNARVVALAKLRKARSATLRAIHPN